MVYWPPLVLGLCIGLMMWYWYHPDLFEVKPHPKHPEKYSEHHDPSLYPKDNR